MPFAKGAAKPAGSGRRKRQPEAPGLTIEYWPIARLKPYENNPRKNDQAVDRMVASIKEFGFTVPVLARSSGEVVDGRLRLKAAAKLKLETLPVILCDSWSEAQVKAFRLLVNRSVGWADWDMEALSVEFAELQEMKFDLTLTGFDTKEIDQFTLQANPAEDDVPPVPETPASRTGDLWLLGGHRLLCGDATSLADAATVLNGAKPFLMVTDPPYGVEYEPEWRNDAAAKGQISYAARSIGKVGNDDRCDWAPAWAFAAIKAERLPEVVAA